MLNCYQVGFGQADPRDPVFIGVVARNANEAVELGRKVAAIGDAEELLSVNRVAVVDAFTDESGETQTIAFNRIVEAPPVCGNVNCEYEGTRQESVGICGMDFRLLFREECHGEYKGPKG